MGMDSGEAPRRGDDCSPRDSVDSLLASWATRRPDLDFSPVAVITRLARVRGYIDAELESVFRGFGLSPADFAVLVTLARIDDAHGLSQHRLAAELALTPGTISVRIDRLVDQGLVERRADPGSRRNSLVTLTAAGEALFERVAPAHLANEQRLLAALSEDERRLLIDLLRKLLVEFEGSTPTLAGGDRIGLVVSPAHVTIAMRAAVGLPPVAGLLVRSVEPGSPAARANLQPGDVLRQAGGRELRSSASLHAAAREAAGGCIPLTLVRGTDTVHTSLALEPGPSMDRHTTRDHAPGRRPEHTM